MIVDATIFLPMHRMVAFPGVRRVLRRLPTRAMPWIGIASHSVMEIARLFEVRTETSIWLPPGKPHKGSHDRGIIFQTHTTYDW